jgi:hypothetical protein
MMLDFTFFIIDDDLPAAVFWPRLLKMKAWAK